MKLEQLREALKDRRLTVISKVTGISHPTLIRIRDCQDANPTHKVMTTLSEYLEKKVR